MLTRWLIPDELAHSLLCSHLVPGHLPGGSLGFPVDILWIHELSTVIHLILKRWSRISSVLRKRFIPISHFLDRPSVGSGIVHDAKVCHYRLKTVSPDWLCTTD